MRNRHINFWKTTGLLLLILTSIYILGTVLLILYILLIFATIVGIKFGIWRLVTKYIAWLLKTDLDDERLDDLQFWGYSGLMLSSFFTTSYTISLGPSLEQIYEYGDNISNIIINLLL